MGGFMSLVALVTAIWMAVDSSQMGYDRRDVKGLAAMTPVGWFVCGLFFWIFALPLYLVKRAELREAGERRRAAIAAGMPPYLPLPAPGQPMYVQGAGQPGYPPPGDGPPGYPPPGYGQSQGYPPTGYGQAPGYGPPPGYPPTAGYGYATANPPGPGPGPGQAPSEPLSVEQVGEQIHKLDELRRSGILTDAEFEQQKAQVLARM
ncbi:MAG: SHOCT domain-containing protein [Nannocystaceae bacterium]